MPYARLHHDSRHPFQWVIVGFNLSYSLFQVGSGVYPGAIENNVDTPFKLIWGAMLFFGSSLALVGMCTGNHSRGVALEGWGMYLMSGGLGVYAVTIFSGGELGSIYAGCILVAVTIACFLRGLQIHKAIRKIGRGEFIATNGSSGE